MSQLQARHVIIVIIIIMIMAVIIIVVAMILYSVVGFLLGRGFFQPECNASPKHFVCQHGSDCSPASRTLPSHVKILHV